jgi:hypothetical protein
VDSGKGRAFDNEVDVYAGRQATGQPRVGTVFHIPSIFLPQRQGHPNCSNRYFPSALPSKVIVFGVQRAPGLENNPSHRATPS